VLLDLDDLMCLWLLRPPYARTEIEQAFWGDEIEADTVRGPLCCGRETDQMPWCIGHLWIGADGQAFFVGLQRGPVFGTFDDGTAWLGDQI
jgi:hypothetical protein